MPAHKPNLNLSNERERKSLCKAKIVRSYYPCENIWSLQVYKNMHRHHTHTHTVQISQHVCSEFIFIFLSFLYFIDLKKLSLSGTDQNFVRSNPRTWGLENRCRAFELLRVYPLSVVNHFEEMQLPNEYMRNQDQGFLQSVCVCMWRSTRTQPWQDTDTVSDV